MKRDDKRLVEGVLTLQQQMNSLEQDDINEIAPAPVEVELQTKISKKELAESEGYTWIEPKRFLPAMGVLPEKLKRQHAHDWEYVRGIFENYVTIGESISFWLCLYPGDKDCLWEIPSNKPVYVPRMVAKHLEETMKFHTFSYIEMPAHSLRTDSETHKFAPTGTQYRGKFRPIGAFA